jgi:arsenate reductase
MSDRTYNVLFLCTGNSARSIMAEALMNQIGGRRFKAFSAGSFPAGKVNPLALDLLDRARMPHEGARSKSWDEFAKPGAPRMDFILTVCDNAAGEVCPVWPGKPVTAHWGVPDPAAVEGTDEEKRAAFQHAATLLRRRIELLANLPIDKLDALSMQAKLREIGKQ